MKQNRENKDELGMITDDNTLFNIPCVDKAVSNKVQLARLIKESVST